jgi:mono/diheme cytochrome c family protein
LAWQAVVWALLAAGGATAQEDASRDTAVAPGRPLVDHRGYRLLVDKAYLPPDFDQETFDRVWEHWPAELRQAASQASPEQRRRMAFTRYGLTGRPDAPDQPLQYVVDAQGQWTMNCLACHGGSVPDGRGGQVVWPGAPNSRYALQTLTEETRLVKVALRKPLSRMDLGSIFIPLGTTHGTTNAVMFGVALMALREPDLSLRRERTLPPMTHHDMDAPPWWHLRRKTKLYIDGFASRGHRPLMQFMLVPQNGPQQFRAWEADFREVLDYLLSIPVPRYPYPIDRALAERGQTAFQRVCAECHGTYGPGGSYPQRYVPLDDVNTDPVRWQSLTAAYRAAYARSWFTDFGRQETIIDPPGYVAPPLDGIWASAPYFHNGSVPTLWHVLFPEQRPVVWRRAAPPDDYDPKRVGLKIEASETVPSEAGDPWQRRAWFDTRLSGKSAAGHRFAEALSDEERRAVLEYLKTL